jgi:23S rRNA 5-hydroxycytidine C2501 synthase
VTDADGHSATAHAAYAHEQARDAAKSAAAITDSLGKLGATIFAAAYEHISLATACFVPPSLVNSLRREALEQLEATRIAQLPRLQRDTPINPPASYPEDTLTYLANVFNHQARDFYAKHGVSA